MTERQPSSPKLTPRGGAARAHWYPYYAGYAPLFVADVLRRQRIGRRSDDMVLDPWNGSGTTTTVCSAQNVPSRGFDLNPAMVVVAKARLLDSNVAASLPPLLEQILSLAEAETASGSPSNREPLTQWFRPTSAMRIRAIATAVRNLLVGPLDTKSILDVNQISAIAAFFYVMLFRFVRGCARSLATSNPTWIRSSVPGSEKLRVEFDSLASGMREDLTRIQLLDRQELQLRRATASIAMADSCSLPIENDAASAIITSPPYCTRIDYAVATRMELAVLDCSSSEEGFDALRRKMLGTTTVSPLKNPPRLSEPIEALLCRIAGTPAKASRSYYEPNYRDYFNKLTASCAEMFRVLRREATCTLVVQDSYFKDLHIDLAGCVEDIMADLNLTLAHRWDYESIRAMRDRRSATRRTARPVESVLTFKKV